MCRHILTLSQDPCAPHYDPKTDLYRVSYQSSLDLSNADWGDIAWRSATSKDLVSWNVETEPALTPDTSYDGKGVFTGCKVPSRDDSLTYVYTSIGALPIHHTLPHIRGSESLSMAKSFDNGKTWQKFSGNPILPSEPQDLDVTGWRDPFVSSWPSMAAALGLDSEETLFGIISGGIRDVTPTTFLYTVNANDLTKWKYVGPLVNFGLNMRPSKWSGDLGRNWEVTNFLTLKDETDSSVSRDFLVMGTEGCLPGAPSPADIESGESSGPSRPIRGQLWMSGSLKSNDSPSSPASSPVQMKYGFGGHLDHGCMYAANSFFDPKTSKHIVWGWITEEDLCDDLRHKQGWSGLLSLPREIRLQTTRKVVRACKSDLEDIISIECEADASGTHTVRTLASEPVQSIVEKLRQKARFHQATMGSPLSSEDSHDLAFTANEMQTTAWELDCSFRVSRRCKNIGIQLIHTQGKFLRKKSLARQKDKKANLNPKSDFTRKTILSFNPRTETFEITRPSFPSTSTSQSEPPSSNLINTTPELAPHTLFTTKTPTNNNGFQTTSEPLTIHAFRDSSVLEVFVNGGRTAISTRLYAAEENLGMRFFVEEDDDDDGVRAGDDDAQSNSELLYAKIWDGIGT
jgi:beta-fructofuranosidase